MSPLLLPQHALASHFPSRRLVNAKLRAPFGSTPSADRLCVWRCEIVSPFLGLSIFIREIRLTNRMGETIVAKRSRLRVSIAAFLRVRAENEA